MSLRRVSLNCIDLCLWCRCEHGHFDWCHYGEHSLTVPSGWKLVPIVPTHEMEKAYKTAMRRYIEDAKQRGDISWRKYPKGGYVIPEREKCFARWTSMLHAAPTPPQKWKYVCDDDCRSPRCPAALERIAAGWRNGRDKE